MDDSILVSVACITYNQEKTVEKMIKSILAQNTSFNFEIIIHDDCSTDKTAEIIDYYAKLYPDIIVPIFENENQCSKGKGIFIPIIYPLVRGKYIAYCEGDDYWTDNEKLQQQFDAMENHRNCTLCVHDVCCVTNKGDLMNQNFPGIEIDEGVIKADKYLYYEFMKKPWLFQTTSYFVKSDIMKELCTSKPSFIDKYPVGDLPIILISLQKGDCFYIKKTMSAYRKNSGGVLTKNKNNLDREIIYYERMLDGHQAYKNYTKDNCKRYVDFTINLTEIKLFILNGEYKCIEKTKYCMVRNILSKKIRILICVGKIFPKLTYCFYKFLRNI